MKPSEQCKEAGLKSMSELSRISSTSVQTLINWQKNKPVLFEVLLAGAVTMSTKRSEGEGKRSLPDSAGT